MDEVFRSLTDGIWSDLDRLPKPSRRQGGKVSLSTSAATSSASTLRRLSEHGPRQ